MYQTTTVVTLLPRSIMNTTILPNRTVHLALRPWPWRVSYYFYQSGLWIPIVFLLFLFAQDPFSTASDYDYDEGINLMKTLLHEQHYRLYQDIWSDQPPLFTVLLGGWFALVGESTTTARILIALFSALLLWSFYLSVHRSVTVFAAIGATLLLVLSQFYLRLSSAVMIGLPALALAMAAIACLVNARGRRPLLVLSGLLMALALETKLFVVILFLAIALYLLLSTPATFSWWRRLNSLFIWFAVVTVTFIALSIYFGALNLDMLLTTHFGAQTRQQANFVQSGGEFLTTFLHEQPVYLAVAFIGLLYAIRQRKWVFLLPFAWFVTVALSFIFHRPLWYHHIMLLTIPMAWLCAFAIEAWGNVADHLIGQTTRRRLIQSALLATTAVASITVFLYYPAPLDKRLDEQAQIYRPLYIWEMVYQLQIDAQTQPGFVFTDRPFYAFQAGLPVTPPIAALSRKRLESGVLTYDDMLAALTQYKPQYIILQRFSDAEYSAEVMAEIHRHYELVLEIDPGRYYRRLPGG